MPHHYFAPIIVVIVVVVIVILAVELSLNNPPLLSIGLRTLDSKILQSTLECIVFISRVEGRKIVKFDVPVIFHRLTNLDNLLRSKQHLAVKLLSVVHLCKNLYRKLLVNIFQMILMIVMSC